MEGRSRKLNIYGFTDYRAFLTAFYRERKRENPNYSFRLFSRAAGLPTDNHLWLVMTGRRNLSNGTVQKFAKGLKLTKREAEFFENLVFFNQAETNEEKNLYYKRLASSKRYVKLRHIERDQFEYFSKWYYAAIRELVRLPQFVEDPAWIAARLKPRVSAKEAKEALELLFRLGLVARAEDGRIVQAERHVGTDHEVASLAVANFHKQMIEKAGESIDLSPAKHRDISSLTFILTKEKIAEAKRRMQEFKREFHEFLAGCEGGDAVYQMNLQLFNLSEVPDEAR